MPLFILLNTRFIYKQHFYKQRQAETCKKLAHAKQHPKAEVLLSENHSLFIHIIIQK